jgi:hypothetical protein
MFADDVRGNVLHEAWDRNGEPLPRRRPGEANPPRAFRALRVPRSGVR